MTDAPGESGGPSREHELADLLDRLLSAGDAERSAILAEIATRDPSQARELAELVAALPDPERVSDAGTDARTHAFPPPDPPGQPSAATDDRFAGEPAVGETLGGCVLESVLGRGGVGTVFAARQIEPPRAVAIKVLRLTQSRARDLGRFRTEASALARLEHPGIARIYASGIAMRADAPLPYIVMERIDGAQSIVDWARAPGRTLRETALAFATICDAMQHGHNRGVIHRDLKPSNILVDPANQPRVIDFGIARLMSIDGDPLHETVVGALLGTPSYMAPEQFELPGSDLDARVDIHAVGLILYEALLGRRAYEITRERAFDARRIVRETDPPAPHRVDSRVPADLSAVAMQAMAKSRDRRYPSMSALAADLRAFADGRAVSARAEGSAERFLRLVRRNPVPAAALTLAVVVLAVAVVLSTLALGAARRRSAAAEMVIAMTAAGDGNVREATAALERIDAPTEPFLRGMVERMLDDSAAEPIWPSVGHLVGGAISPDATHWAAGGDGGAIVVADARGGEIGRAKLGESSVWATAFSPDGTRLYAGDWKGTIVEIDMRAAPAAPAPRGATPPVLPTRIVASVHALVRGIAVSRDGKRLVVLSSPLVLSSIDLATGAVHSSPSASPQGMARSLAWNGEDRAFVTGGTFDIAAFDVPAEGAPVRAEVPWLAGILPRTSAVGISRDASLLAVADTLGHVAVVDARTGARRFGANCAHDVWSLDFSHDGARLAVAERGGRVHEFLTADGTLLARHGTLSKDPAWAVGYAPDGSICANIGLSIVRFAADRAWSTDLGRFPRGQPRATTMLGRDTKAPTLRAAANDGSVWDLDIARGSWREVPLAEPVAPGPAAFDPAGARLAAWCDSGVEIVRLDGGARVRVPLPPRGRREIAWDPAGDELTIVSEGEVRILRDDGAELARTTVDTSSQGHDLAYESTRRPIVFIRYSDRAAIVRDGRGGAAVQTAPVPSATKILRIGSRWVLPTLGGPVLVSRQGGLQQLGGEATAFEAKLDGHTDVGYAAAITPDGRILATAGADTRIRFWDLARGELLATAMVCDEPVRTLEWIDGGRALVAVDGAGKVTLLDSVAKRARLAQSSAPQASTR